MRWNGEVDNVAYNSTFAYSVYGTFDPNMQVFALIDIVLYPIFHFYDPVQRPIMRHRAKFREDRRDLFWLTTFQISSKSVHFRRSYSRPREGRSKCTIKSY